MNAPDKLRAWAEIDLGTLERNLQNIRASLPERIKYVAVVKADAYGHGIGPVVHRLMRSGADCFAVANLAEAADIREVGSGWPILVLSAILPSEDGDLIAARAMPTVSSLEEVVRFTEVARKAGRRLAVHLKIDTGMGRLGVWHSEARELYLAIRNAPELLLDGIYTHFSCADCDAEYTRQQRDTFFATLDSFPDLQREALLIHADNSSGLDSFPKGGPLNGARVGLLQFGVCPYANSLLSTVHVGPVFSFHARVGLVKRLPAGTGVSYGRRHILSRDTRTAIITAGYGDGVPTTLSNRGEVLIHGHRCKILGRVTMDQTIVDVTDLPEVSVGDVATFVGTQGGQSIGIEEFSHLSEQIPWEAFCAITKRVQRITAPTPRSDGLQHKL